MFAISSAPTPIGLHRIDDLVLDRVEVEVQHELLSMPRRRSPTGRCRSRRGRRRGRRAPRRSRRWCAITRPSSKSASLIGSSSPKLSSTSETTGPYRSWRSSGSPVNRMPASTLPRSPLSNASRLRRSGPRCRWRTAGCRPSRVSRSSGSENPVCVLEVGQLLLDVEPFAACCLDDVVPRLLEAVRAAGLRQGERGRVRQVDDLVVTVVDVGRVVRGWSRRPRRGRCRSGRSRPRWYALLTSRGRPPARRSPIVVLVRGRGGHRRRPMRSRCRGRRASPCRP